MRIYIPRTRWMIALVYITVIQAIILVGLQIYGLHLDAKAGWTKSVDIGRACVVIFELLYQVFLIVDAGRRKNIVQIIGVVVNNVSMLVFFVTIVEVVNGISFRGRFSTPFMLILTLSTILMALGTWLGFREFEW